MKSIVFIEIRNKIREIENINVTCGHQHAEGTNLIINAIHMMLNCNKIVKEEGLLALENICCMNYFDDVPCSSYLKEMIQMICEGRSVSDIEYISLMKYFVRDLKDYDGFIYLVYLNSALLLCEGTATLIFEQKIESMIPVSIMEAYQLQKQEWITKEQDEEIQKGLIKIKEICDNASLLSNEDIQLVNTDITNMSDKEIQAILRNTETYMVTVAMKGWDKTVVKRIFDNMSKRLSIMVAEDMEKMDDVTFYDIVNANKIIAETIVSLKKGEIT